MKPQELKHIVKIFEAAEVPLMYEPIEMGKQIYEAGHSTGMTDDAKKTVETTGILFKGPMETPKGKGVNITASACSTSGCQPNSCYHNTLGHQAAAPPLPHPSPVIQLPSGPKQWTKQWTQDSASWGASWGGLISC